MAIENIDDPVAEVIHLRSELATTKQYLADEVRPLAERVAHLVATITGPAPLGDVRSAMNEVGIQQARKVLTADAIDACENALLALRRCQEAERNAREARDQAVSEAMWTLEARHFVSRSNKQWLAVDADGSAIPEADQKSYDASARKEWLEYHAARVPAVAAASAALRHAEEETRAAADAVAIADKRFSAAKHNVDAAAAQLAALQRCLPREA